MSYSLMVKTQKSRKNGKLSNVALIAGVFDTVVQNFEHCVKNGRYTCNRLLRTLTL